jgi:hypothetical protein
MCQQIKRHLQSMDAMQFDRLLLQLINHPPADLVDSMRRSDSKDFVLDRFQMRIHSRSILTLRKCVEQLMHGS